MNKRYNFSILLYLCFAIFLVACSGSSKKSETLPESKHFFWKVSDENSSVWVLGSIHLADSTLYPLAPVIDSAFAHSDELAVELNMNDEEVVKEVGEQSAAQGLLTEGTLRDLLPQDMWNTVDSLCTAWNVPIVMIEKTRPWLAAMTLSSYAFMQAGLNPEYGIDYVLLDRAAMDEIAEFESLVSNLMHAWKTGDDEMLRRLLDDGEEEVPLQESKFKDEFEQRIYVNRNAKMADSIATFLREDRKVFVVVGVAHLALEKDNVIETLRKRGFKIERF